MNTKTINCSICNNNMSISEKKYLRMLNANQSQLFYCSSNCTWSKLARKMRYENQAEKIFKKHGVRNSFQLPAVIKVIQSKRNESEITEKKKLKFLSVYGVDNPMKNAKIREKTSNTNLVKYGNICSANSLQAKEKGKVTLINKYGADSFFKSDEFKNNIKRILKEKYGNENYYKIGSPQFKSRMMELYGVENCMHVPEIADKVLAAVNKGKYKYKTYIFPSGNRISIQGFENKTLDKLLALGYLETDILNCKRDMPQIYYFHDLKTRRYYPDFFIPKDNLIIETKSSYYLELEREQNLKKFSAVKALGYTLIVDVY